MNDPRASGDKGAVTYTALLGRVLSHVCFLSLICFAGLARAQDLPVQLSAGEAPLRPAQVRESISNQLSRPVALVDALPSEGAAVSLEGTAPDLVQVRCRDAKGINRSR